MSILFRMARAAAFMFLMLSLITGMTGRAGAEEQEVKHVLANGLNIAYTEQGEGPAIVLIHGGGLTSAMWAKQIPALAKKYRVITPDTRGHGKTDNPSHRFGYSLQADDVAAFCTAPDLKKPVLMGYSDGGIIALTVGIAYPELAGALVIGGAVPPSGQADLDHYFAGMKAFYAPVTKRGALTDDDLDAMYAANPEGWDFMAKMHAKPGQPDYWRTLMKDVWLTWNTPQSYAYPLEKLQNITIPALVILGDRDDFFLPVSAAQFAAQLPAGELAVIPGGAHSVFRDKPELFNALVLDFLTRNAASRP